jgi:hypothetical protein
MRTSWKPRLPERAVQRRWFQRCCLAIVDRDRVEDSQLELISEQDPGGFALAQTAAAREDRAPRRWAMALVHAAGEAAA